MNNEASIKLNQSFFIKYITNDRTEIEHICSQKLHRSNPKQYLPIFISHKNSQHSTRFHAIHHRNSTLSLLCKRNGNIDVLPFPRANFNLWPVHPTPRIIPQGRSISMKTGNYRIPANRPQHCSAGSVTIPTAHTTYTCVLPNRPQPPDRSTPFTYRPP